MIKFDNVTATYKTGAGIFNINFELNKSEMIFLMGPTGSGKSTLLKTIYKELDIDSGEIFIDNKEISNLRNNEIPFLRRKIGMIFQDFRLLNDRNIFDNISLPLKIAQYSKDEVKDKTLDIIQAVGLSNKDKRYPDQLSGGEQQRVAIARAIVKEPKILLADEPTANLDAENAHSILKTMKNLNKELDTTFIFSTHDEKVMKYLSRTIVLKDGKIDKERANKFRT